MVLLFQSTLLQEERHITFFPFVLMLIISIHAPTRGATMKNLYKQYEGNISIHAPTRGATIMPYYNKLYKSFQSTLLQEERLWSSVVTLIRVDFNPRSYKRSDRVRITHGTLAYYFNPRSYKRSDLDTVETVFVPSNFNPRSYKRSDVVSYK